MRILISTVADGTDRTYARILDRLDAEPCGIIFLNLKDPNRFPLTRKFAKYAFSYEYCHIAQYEQQPLYAECPPLEPELLEKLAPDESENFHVLLRDRLPDYRSMWLEYCKHVRFWDHALDVMRIDAFVLTATPHVQPDNVIASLCKLRGIPVIAAHGSYLRQYGYMVDTLEDPCPQMRDAQERLREKYADAAAEEIPLAPDFEEYYQGFHRPGVDMLPIDIVRPVKKDGAAAAVVDGLLKPVFSGKAKLFEKNSLYMNHLYQYSFWRYWRCVYLRTKLVFFLAMNVFNFNIKKYHHIRRKLLGHRVYLESEVLLRHYKELSRPPQEGEKFILVALHLQPELSTVPMGGAFGDQLLMVKMLSAHLPKGYWLYVKEHPNQMHQNRHHPTGRSAEFYDEMAKLGNVKIISVNVDSYALQEKCAAVATVTGTAGFETINRGKPFLMFGNSIAMYAPGVFRIRSNRDCAEAMRRIEEGSVVISAKDLRIHYKALEECTIKGVVDALFVKEEDMESAAEATVDAYVRQIEKKTSRKRK